MKRFALLTAILFASPAFGQYTQADADAARAAAVSETSAATSEYSSALSGVSSRWYLRGALNNLRCGDQPFIAGDLHYARGDYRNAVLGYTGARNYATVSRRWTNCAVVAPHVYPDGIVR